MWLMYGEHRECVGWVSFLIDSCVWTVTYLVCIFLFSVTEKYLMYAAADWDISCFPLSEKTKHSSHYPRIILEVFFLILVKIQTGNTVRQTTCA